MTDFAHQLIAAMLILIGAVKAIFGYFIMKSATDHGDIGIALRRPWHASFRLLLGLAKGTSDAPLYVILGVMTAASPEPVETWALIWISYCCAIQIATFLKWAEAQGEQGDERTS